MTVGPILGSMAIHGEGAPTRVRWSRDGHAVIAEAVDRTLRLLDEQRTERWRIPGPPCRSAEIVARGQRIALQDVDGAGTLLHIETGQVVARLERAPIEAWSHDGSRAIGRRADGTVRVWDAMTGAEVWTLPAEEITSVALSADGRRALLGRQDCVELWDVDARHCLRRHDDRLLALLDRRAFTLDDQRVLAGTAQGIVKLWDLASGEQIWSHLVVEHEPRCFAFSGDGVLALSSGSFGVVKVWDLATGAELRTFQAGPPSAALKIGFSPDGREILAACADTRFRRFNVDDGAELEVVDGQGWNRAVAFTPDGSRLFLPRDDRRVASFDARGGGPMNLREDAVFSEATPPGQELDDPPGASTHALADGRVLHWENAGEEADSQVWLEDPPSGRATRRHRGQSVALAVGSRLPLVLAKQWWGRPLVLWHAEHGELARLDLPDHDVACAAFSPDERAAVVATFAGVLLRIDVELS